MTPLVRTLRRWRDKWLGQWYEGPEAPARLREMVLVFANEHPQATRAEWVEYAAEHAAQSYLSGYIRGEEWAERDKPDPDNPTPEQIADTLDPDWRWSPDIQLEGDPDAVVLDLELGTLEQLQRLVDKGNRP